METKIIQVDYESPTHRKALGDILHAHLDELRDAIIQPYGPLQADEKENAKERSKNMEKNAALLRKVVQRFRKREEELQSLIHKKEGIVHLLFVDGKVAGYVHSYRKEKIPQELVALIRQTEPDLAKETPKAISERVLFGGHGYIRPEYRRQKLGNRLYEEHETRAVSDFHGTATHRVAQLEADEHDGHRFLKKQGYATLGSHEGRGVSIKRIGARS